MSEGSGISEQENQIGLSKIRKIDFNFSFEFGNLIRRTVILDMKLYCLN